MNKTNKIRYVECINNKNNDTTIIEGKIYKVYEELADSNEIRIKNSLGNFGNYSIDNFREVKPIYKVMCINNQGREKTLTTGKMYEVLYKGGIKTPLYLIEDDLGDLKSYGSTRFNVISSVPKETKEEDNNSINKKEAIKLMLDGKKVTHDDWKKESYIYIDKNGTIKDECNEEMNLNFFPVEGWKEYIEDNRKEVPEQMEHLKDIWNMIFDEVGHSKAPCYSIESCDNCPLIEEDTGNCYDYYIADILKKINKNWKLDR